MEAYSKKKTKAKINTKVLLLYVKFGNPIRVGIRALNDFAVSPDLYDAGSSEGSKSCVFSLL